MLVWDLNSLASNASYTAGYWSGEFDEDFNELKLNNGVNYQVWIDFLDSKINVTMALAGVKKPRKPLISEVVDLSGVLLDEMYVGFCGATGALVESHRILAWSFSNSNFSIGDGLVTQNLPSFVASGDSAFGSKGGGRGKKGRRWRKLKIGKCIIGLHGFDYEEIRKATERFAEKNVIGIGGNGRFNKGLLQE
ncbi:hypothetical protein GBA52_010506 [Prunus armeniaca]|nr:hypothetical protein GBA52_010506 [Prunus armeniaca]